MPQYEFRCDACQTRLTKRLPMAQCASSFPCEKQCRVGGVLREGVTKWRYARCKGTLRRVLSADFQTTTQLFHQLPENKYAFGMQSGVFSEKDQTEHRKMRDKEYEAKWRPSQNPSPFASSIE